MTLSDAIVNVRRRTFFDDDVVDDLRRFSFTSTFGVVVNMTSLFSTRRKRRVGESTLLVEMFSIILDEDLISHSSRSSMSWSCFRASAMVPAVKIWTDFLTSSSRLFRFGPDRSDSELEKLKNLKFKKIILVQISVPFDFG